MKKPVDSTREALYKAIVAHPDDDTPRLAFADYLDECGDPTPKAARAAGGPHHVPTGPNAAHAEFIRLQCRLETMNEWDHGYTAADIRCRRLAAEHPEWVEPVDEWYKPNSYSPPEFGGPLVRGFPEHLCRSPEELLPVWDKLFAEFPIRTVQLPLWNSSEEMGRRSRVALNDLLSRPECTRIRRIGVRQPLDGFPSKPVPLGKNPHLRGLKELIYWGDLRGEEIRELIESPHLAGLEAFTHYGSLYGDDNAARAVGKWKWFPNLKNLSLRGDFFGPMSTTVNAIKHFYQDADVFKDLTRLALDGYQVLPAEHFPRLLASGKLAGLQSLELDMPQFDDDTFRKLSKAKGPRELSHFSLSSLINPIGGNPSSNIPETLFAAKWFTWVRSLQLRGSHLRDNWLTAIANARYTAVLRRLDLFDNNLTEAGLRDFLKAPAGWPCLAHLNLRHNRIEDDVLAKLVDHRGLPSLISLAVGDKNSKHAPKFLVRLAESPASTRFRELDLQMYLDDATADALWKSPHLEQLDILRVRKGRAGRTAWTRLQRRFGPRLIPR